MSNVPVSTFLQRVLLADGAISLASGLLMALGGSWLEGLLGLPAWLLVPAGLSLFVYTAAAFWMARRASVPRLAVWVLIAINVAWAVDCVAIAAGPWFAPTGLGQAFLAAHVITVLVFAELQFMGLRRGDGAARTGQRQLA